MEKNNFVKKAKTSSLHSQWAYRIQETWGLVLHHSLTLKKSLSISPSSEFSFIKKSKFEFDLSKVLFSPIYLCVPFSAVKFCNCERLGQKDERDVNTNLWPTHCYNCDLYYLLDPELIFLPVKFRFREFPISDTIRRIKF